MHSLADRLARGDDSAFAELYDACADRLYRYAAARLGSRDAAADVVQTAFMRAVKSRKKFRGIKNPVAYLFQIARNETLRAATLRKRQPIELAAADTIQHEADNEAGADDAEALAVALAKLDDADREIVELKTYAGLTFAEIATVLDRPPGTVATRYRRALESLREWLQRELSRE